MITILMMSGCRRGELMGLKWDRVDFEQGTIRIDNNDLYVPGVGLYEDTPQTEKSKRTIALPPQTMELLRQYKKCQEVEIKRLGNYYRDQNFLFAQEGRFSHAPGFGQHLAGPFSKRHGLPHINPPCLPAFDGQPAVL